MLDHMLLRSVLAGFDKSAFVPMPGGSDPAAQGGQQPQGGQPQQGGGDPAAQGGQPQQGGQPPSGATALPPEALQMLQDPQVQQMLQQNQITVQDPASGTLAGPDGQPLAAEQVMQILQQVQQMQQEQQQKDAPKTPQGAPAPSIQIDISDVQKLIEGAVTNAVRGVAQKEFSTLFKDMTRQVSDLSRQMQQEMRTTTQAAKGQQGGAPQIIMAQPPQQQQGSQEIAMLAQQVAQTNAMLRSAMGGGRPAMGGAGG
jgi:hypothetical protein